MNDRELLEAAAKAAGLDVVHMALSGFNIISGPDMGTLWNPLIDGGQALQLVGRLRMRLHVEKYGAAARISGERWWGCEAHLHGGIESATRRAIVLCAANAEQTTQPAPLETGEGEAR